MFWKLCYNNKELENDTQYFFGLCNLVWLYLLTGISSKHWFDCHKWLKLFQMWGNNFLVCLNLYKDLWYMIWYHSIQVSIRSRNNYRTPQDVLYLQQRPYHQSGFLKDEGFWQFSGECQFGFEWRHRNHHPHIFHNWLHQDPKLKETENYI